MDQRRRDGQMISYYLLKTCDSMRKMQILYILPQPVFRLSFFSSLWNMRNQSCSWIVKLAAISVLVNNNFVEIWLKPWCLWRWARFPWGKRLIKAQEMEDLFCIKYLEKGRSLNPLVITKCQGMLSLLLDSSIKLTCPLIWHTSPFRSGLPHFVRVVYIISSNSFYFPLPENSFQNALLQIIYVNLKITVALTMVTINVPSGSCDSVNITRGIWLHKSRQAASQVQISLTCFPNHLFTLHGHLGSYLEMREDGWIEKEKNI